MATLPKPHRPTATATELDPRPEPETARARIEQLDTPVVIVDLDVLERNLTTMAERAKRAGVRLRPHAKTHKSAWIGHEQLRQGASGLTLAKLGEAEVMADAGIDDILVAYPIVGQQKLARLRALAERIRVVVAIDDVVVAEGLSGMARSMARPLEVYVEVDSGFHRLGRPPGSPSADSVEQIAGLPGLVVSGLMTFAGHSYGAPTTDERREVALTEARALVETAVLLAARGLQVAELSLGSTPTAVHLEEVRVAYPAITEARPGNYVFNDANQIALGVAREADCSLRVVATIVSRPAEDRAVADVGSKTLGADAGVAGGFGSVRGHPDAFVERLNEEHATIRIRPETPWRIGDRIEIIPNHACVVPNLVGELVGVRKGLVERSIAVEARGKNR